MNIDHLSYSTCKKIYRKGVDYAVAAKLGIISEPTSKAADIGTMVHASVLGGNPQWILSPYKDFRTNEAKAWKAEQTAIILKEDEVQRLESTAKAIVDHPLALQLLETCEHEQKLEATINNIKFHGCADGISKDRKTIFDLKTTEQFDMFKWQAFKNDYDLQASVYTLFGDNADYYFIVAETCFPFRVQIFGTSPEFIDNGNKKLDAAITQFHEFRQRDGDNDIDRITFNVGETEKLENVELLGDWS